MTALETRVQQLEQANGRLRKRQQAMDIDTEYAETARQVHSDWEAAVSRLYGGYAEAYSRYQTALADAAAARAFWATVAAGVFNIAAAVVMERLLLAAGARSADAPPGTGIFQRLRYVEGAENPANALVGAVTSTGAVAFGSYGGTGRPQPPQRPQPPAPPAASPATQPSSGPDVSDPFALYAFAHARVAQSSAAAADFFRRQAHERANAAHEQDDFWDRFNPEQYRQQLQQWHTSALQVPGGARFQPQEVIGNILERAMWARWLPTHMDHEYVDRSGELRRTLEGPPRAIGARLDALGITRSAGVNSLLGWWYVSGTNLGNLRGWAASHQPPVLYT